MRNFFSLLKLQINNEYGISYFRYIVKKDKKALFKGLGIGFIILIALVQLLGVYSFMIWQLYKGAAVLNVSQVVLTVSSIISGVFLLFFGIFYILSSLFLAKDTEFLASLPIKQGSVFLSKFILVLLNEYPFAFFLMMPPVIIYGTQTGKGPLYYVLAIICTLFLPLLPLLFSAILSLLLMNAVARSKRRDLITIVGSFILMVIIFAGENYIASRLPENPQEFVVELLKNSSMVIDFMGRIFPPSIWLTKALSLTGWDSFVNFAYLILSSAVFLGAVYLLASFIYQKGAVAQLETLSKTRKAKLTYSGSSHVMAMFKNEWRVILRTPVYALNSLTVIIMAPLMMLFPKFGAAGDPDIQALYNLIQNERTQPGLILIVAGIISGFALINPAVSTSISREGKNIWVLKNIPVKPEVMVKGKLLAGFSISFVAVVLASFVTMYSFKLTIIQTAMIIILSSVAQIPVCAISLLIDIIKPKLTWSNPQEAIKQNMNGVLGMLIGIAFLLAIGVILFFIVMTGLNVYTIFGIALVLLASLSYTSLRILYAYAEKGFRKIEA